MCLFCKIAAKEIKAKILFETDNLVAFHDTNPQAPTHVLLIPKRHIVGIAEATAQDDSLLGKLLLGAKRVGEELGLKKGYRVVINSGPDAGQSVFHLHVHVMGGRPMAWPPG
jgi:histidine triad (HIT) family protein